MTPSPASSASSACSTSGSPSSASRSMTRRAVDASAIEAPSSEKPTAPGLRHARQVGGLRAGPPDRRGADHPDPAGAVRGRPVGDRRRRVEGRFGVRHRADRREPTARRRPSAARDRLGGLAARLAEVGVEVAQAGRQHEPAAVDPLGGRIGLPRDDAIDDGQVPDLIGPGSRVDDAGADHGEGWRADRSGSRRISRLMRLRRRGPGRPSAPGRRSRPGGRSGSAARWPARR